MRFSKRAAGDHPQTVQRKTASLAAARLFSWKQTPPHHALCSHTPHLRGSTDVSPEAPTGDPSTGCRRRRCDRETRPTQTSATRRGVPTSVTTLDTFGRKLLGALVSNDEPKLSGIKKQSMSFEMFSCRIYFAPPHSSFHILPVLFPSSAPSLWF